MLGPPIRSREQIHAGQKDGDQPGNAVPVFEESRTGKGSNMRPTHLVCWVLRRRGGRISANIFPQLRKYVCKHMRTCPPIYKPKQVRKRQKSFEINFAQGLHGTRGRRHEKDEADGKPATEDTNQAAGNP
jgi:hypothetical protein